METILGKLVAKEIESGGYITYVFEIEEREEIKSLQTKYIMCTQFPNWEHRELQLGEVGYLSYQEIIAGVTQWFDGKDMVKYRYNMIQFLKFITKPLKREFKYRLD